MSAPLAYVKFGHGHYKKRIRFDAKGRPFVRWGAGGYLYMIYPGGDTSNGREEWIPLNKAAAEIFDARNDRP